MKDELFFYLNDNYRWKWVEIRTRNAMFVGEVQFVGVEFLKLKDKHGREVIIKLEGIDSIIKSDDK